MRSHLILFLSLCITVCIPAVTGYTLLGFYWGADEVLKKDGISLFYSDWEDISPKIVVEWVFMIITTLWTTVWIIHHVTTVPHFKFEFHIISRISIRTHICAGSLEFILLYFVYFLDDSTSVTYMVYAVVAVDMVHEITASYQAPSTYGQKYITFPAYVWVIAMKGALALYYLQEPLSRFRFFALYASHSQFTWLRLLYYLFMRMHIFTATLYTSCMVIGVTLCQSLISGCNGPLIFIIYIVSAANLARKLKPKFLLGGYRESGRNSAYFFTDDLLDMIVRKLHQFSSLDHKGRVLFEFIDTNDSGRIAYNEISEMFMNCGVSLEGSKRIFDEMDVDDDAGISVEEFIAHPQLKTLVKQFEKDVTDTLRERSKMQARREDVYREVDRENADFVVHAEESALLSSK